MNFKLPTTNYQLPTGFTLIETLVAVVIVSLSVVGPLYAADRAIVATQIARSQLTASYLAQEGVEYVRAVRDNAFLAAYPGGGSGWDSFLSACASGCQPAGYAAGSGTFASFARTVQVASITATDARITSRVSWTFHGTPYSVTVTDHLTPWQ